MVNQQLQDQLIHGQLLKVMVEVIEIRFVFVVNVDMLNSMLMFEFVHAFQFVQQYHVHFVRMIQNDCEMIYEIDINVQFQQAKNHFKEYLWAFI